MKKVDKEDEGESRGEVKGEGGVNETFCCIKLEVL